jgi:MFS superfamily sulfate permease-like transporter
VQVRGALTFLGVPRLLDALARVPAGQPVEVDLAVSSVDHAAWEALEGWRAAQERSGGAVRLDGLSGMWSVGLEPRDEEKANEAAGIGQAALAPMEVTSVR